MMFLLTFLKIAYVLDINQPATEPKEGDTDEIKAARIKRGEDELLCRGHILNALSDRLFDLYSSIKSPLKIWNALEQKYNNEKQDTDKFLTMKYFEFAMRDLLWIKYNQNSKVNFVSEKNKNTNPSEVGKKRKSFDSDSKKRHVTCYNCGKKGHIKKDCRFRKKQKKEGMPNVQVAETNVEEIIAMVSNLHIGMVTELNMAAAVKSFDWWYDSGATVHVYNDRSQFKHYEDAAEGQQVLMGNANTTIVLGKGNVEIQFTSGKKMLLTNVLHVPEIRKNLVSAAILSKKGLKTVIEADKLIVGKGYYCDGMFKPCTTMNVMNKFNNSAYVLECSLSSL
ncbi:UNVERIFIED_CONTAM: hypothetical protein Sradi_1579900 [Sesamum radiatum]|uniref:CCHC-type domain-containing protein n=1 Tax=Sesamum radiatum TaxID=300843 RepID=A0AAW2UAQ2_SESRA